jgi:UDP-glucose 4-epimerase
MGRIVVTGGAGFIGSHLVERLVAAGEDVVVLDDLSRGHREWLPPRTELHELDIGDRGSLKKTLPVIAPKTVVHLAAMHYIPAVEDAPTLAEEVNVTGTNVLLEALVARPPEVLLFASTAAVYPDRAGPIAESCVPEPIDLYGRTKLEGERMVEEFAQQTGAQVIVARIFNVIGPRETNPHVLPDVIDQLRREKVPLRIGNLRPRRDYTDVRDVAAALERLLAFADDDRTVFNLGSGRSVSVSELVQVCEEIIGRPIDIQVEQRRVRSRDRAELVADSRLLRETTGWRPTHSLRDTLAELLLADSEPLTRFGSDTR